MRRRANRRFRRIPGTDSLLDRQPESRPVRHRCRVGPRNVCLPSAESNGSSRGDTFFGCAMRDRVAYPEEPTPWIDDARSGIVARSEGACFDGLGSGRVDAASAARSVIDDRPPQSIECPISNPSSRTDSRVGIEGPRVSTPSVRSASRGRLRVASASRCHAWRAE